MLIGIYVRKKDFSFTNIYKDTEKLLYKIIKS